MLTQTRLQELIRYDSITGEFHWNVSRGRVKAHTKAGTLAGSGYVHIRLFGKIYQAHRLAWLYAYGNFPKEGIDHINRVKSDNRICNLREATKSQNAQNTSVSKTNTSGIKGVSWCKRDSKWRAYIKVNGRYTSLGYYKNIDDAEWAYMLAAKAVHTHNCV